MKTIGYVLSAFPVLSETFVGNEMRTMQLIGHTVVPIACSQPEGHSQPDDKLLWQSARYLANISLWQVLFLCICHPLGFLNALTLAYKQKGIRPRSALFTAAKVACFAKSSKCQHLHAHFALQSASAALIAARWLRLTVSFVGHGYDVYATPADLPLKLSEANFAVAVCLQMQRDFQLAAPQAKVALIPCGIELSRFQYAPILKPGKGLLFIGRLAEKKGLPILLEAIASLPPEKRPLLDIVGDGELKTELLHTIEALNLSPTIRLLGAKDSQWICRHANQYIALVAPFQIAKNGDRDTGPLVLKEAMALGLPVISSNLMGCNEIVGNDCGFLIHPEDVKALSEAICHVQQLTPTQRQTLVSLARVRIEQQFSVLTVCRNLSAQIEAL